MLLALIHIWLLLVKVWQSAVCHCDQTSALLSCRGWSVRKDKMAALIHHKINTYLIYCSYRMNICGYFCLIHFPLDIITVCLLNSHAHTHSYHYQTVLHSVGTSMQTDVRPRCHQINTGWQSTQQNNNYKYRYIFRNMNTSYIWLQ